MPIDTKTERLITFGDALALFPEGTTAKELRRWREEGVRVKGTCLHKLEAQPIGRIWYTSAEAVQRFLAGLAAASAELEELIPFSQAVLEFPIRTTIKTLHRWRLKGTRGVKLDCVRRDRNWFTSREAIQRFIDAQAAGPSIKPRPATSIADKAAQRRSTAAREELAAMGIGSPQ